MIELILNQKAKLQALGDDFDTLSIEPSKYDKKVQSIMILQYTFNGFHNFELFN